MQLSSQFAMMVSMRLITYGQLFTVLDDSAILMPNDVNALQRILPGSLRVILAEMAAGRVPEHASMASADFQAVVSAVQASQVANAPDPSSFTDAFKQAITLLSASLQQSSRYCCYGHAVVSAPVPLQGFDVNMVPSSLQRIYRQCPGSLRLLSQALLPVLEAVPREQCNQSVVLYCVHLRNAVQAAEDAQALSVAEQAKAEAKKLAYREQLHAETRARVLASRAAAVAAAEAASQQLLQEEEAAAQQRKQQAAKKAAKKARQKQRKQVRPCSLP